MAFEKGRHAATADRPPPVNQRREHLVALAETIQVQTKFMCRVVERNGVPLLQVRRSGHLPAEVGCDFTDGEWWFTWADDGRTIATAGETEATALRIARVLEGDSK